MNFLLGILEGGGSVDEHPLIQQLLDLFWLLMEDYEVNECLKQLMMSLLRAYRFSPIIPDLGFQVGCHTHGPYSSIPVDLLPVLDSGPHPLHTIPGLHSKHIRHTLSPQLSN
ncbi:unnamed protein product [Oncorhynchus mykiss]|uniref:Uncharacterized protein n=1 Tax=Oncorhynchus mykiss TaxID=8022 RepID=A0A061A5I4_ONCMY|nr:unnamed protein product [Oncorhynchus mykiss]